MRKKPDVLKVKKIELNTYAELSNRAISIVTDVVNSLRDINSGIEKQMNDIEQYQAALTNTRDGLDQTRAKNSRVIKNFNALLEVE